MPTGRDYLERSFRHFTGFCAERSPLYAALAAQVAEDPALLALASTGQKRQPPPNLLFGAVHDLLLAGADHPLAAFYPSVGGRRGPDEADLHPLFADFCRRYEPAIVESVSTRRVQTNEVGRCGLLLPAFDLAFAQCGRRPLSLIEVGASAGLNLLFDRYRYEYAIDGAVHECGPPSPARVRTEVKADGVRRPLPAELPPVAERVGVDIAPVRVADTAAVRWVQALIWPDDVDRIGLHRAAVDINRARPPRVIAGDGMAIVPDLVAAAPPGTVACVYHSHATYQMTRDWRRDFNLMLADLGRERDVAHVSLEWLGDDPGPQLHVSWCRGGDRHTTHLASCHHHGRWIRWERDG